MKKKMKLFSLLSVVCASTLVLGACNSGSSESSEDTTLEVWTAYTEGQDTAKYTEDMIEAFEEETGYTVNQTNFTYDMMHDKILASAAGDNLPDVIWGLPEYIGEFYNMGILEDLTESWESWDENENFSDSVKEAMTIDGKMVGIPYEATVRAYLTHETDFSESGYSVPTTWEELLEMTNYDEEMDKYPYSVAGKGVREPQELLVYLAQYGLEIASEQSDGKYKNTWLENDNELENATKVFQFYKDLIANNIVDPNSANFGWEETDENFATGIVASYVTGNWLSEREETNQETMADVAVNPIPYPEDGVEATYLEAKPVFVLTGSNNKEGAIELAKAFSDKDYQNEAFQDRSSRNDVVSESKWGQDFQELIEYGITFPPVTLSNISQNMIDALAKVLQEDEDPKVAAEWLSEEVNKSLQESGEYSE